MSKLRDKLDAYSIPEPNSGCQLWLGATTNGYGRIEWEGKLHSANRLSWEEKNGPIPKGLYACHKCDVRECVNLDHIFVGTQMQNMLDMRAKDRAPRGTKHWNARLTPSQVLAIRDDKRRGVDIAIAYSITPQAVFRIQKRHAWKHL